MNKFDEKYIEILEEILYGGSLEPNRTGIPAYTIPSAYIKHDLSDGFPLLTTRKIPYKSIKVELEGFLKGINDKSWYQERGCKYWDEWCNPKKVLYSNDSETKSKMLLENDLGIIYGNNWREFGVPIQIENDDYVIQSAVDQLKNIIDTIKHNKHDRRLLCLSWNPLSLDYAALPACHVLWRIMVINNKLHLTWYQRSVDYVLGLPSNMASYATLLHLLSNETGHDVGTITAHLDCVHIYENHVEQVKTMINDCNLTTQSPTIKTPFFKSIFNWEYNDTIMENYKPQMNLKFEVAV
jgi:thymidylate synthase